MFFMVFRESGGDYNLVEKSYQRVDRTAALVNGFGCAVEQLDETQQFQVQENDIIAACTVDNSALRPLHVHAINAGGHTLRELSDFDTGSTDSCSATELSTVKGSDLEMRDNYALHLFANIGKYYITI